jgi:hypothetical protein
MSNQEWGLVGRRARGFAHIEIPTCYKRLRLGGHAHEINRSSSISGPTLASHTIGIDAAKPDPAVQSCARLCNGHLGCSAFDISVV